MKSFQLIVILFLAVLELSGQNSIPFETKMIWNQGDHNAFTDLIFFKGKFYCSFREGSGHVTGDEDVDGTVRILVSDQGEKWNSVSHISLSGVDLRDPKMSITPDGRLMVLMGGSYYDKHTLEGRNPQVSFSEDGISFSEPRPIIMATDIKSEMDWVWRVTWHKGVGYAVNYQYDDNKYAYVVKTLDGIHYVKVSELFISGRPNEATVRFSDNDEMLIMLRREEQGKEGLLLRSNKPYTAYTVVDLGRRLGGPNMILLPNTNKLILGTRVYSEEGATTGLFLSGLDGQMKELLQFPSGGDTSYPGLLWHGDSLWVSYYASHEGKTSIYLARIKQEDLYLSLSD